MSRHGSIVLEHEGLINISVLDDPFMQQVGLSEDQYSRFVEMEMTAFAITIECRRYVAFGCDRRRSKGVWIAVQLP